MNVAGFKRMTSSWEERRDKKARKKRNDKCLRHWEAGTV
jgi:hypothetical protein